jgi:lysophospholipase L1-like esterase
MVAPFAAILIFSSWLNWQLYGRARHYYGQLCQTQLDPDGMLWNPGFARGQVLTQNTDILIIGDSRAHDWNLPYKGKLANAGISGQTTVQILLRYRQNIRATSPKLVLIQAGINDLKAIPMLPTRRREIIDLCKSNIVEMVSIAKQEGTTVLLTTIIPAGKVPIQRRTVWSEDVDAAIREVNLFMLTLRSDGVSVVDLSSAICDPRGRTDARYMRDFLHLNVEGYLLLNQMIRPVLDAQGFSFTSN